MAERKLDLKVVVPRPGRFGTSLLIPLAENLEQVTVCFSSSEANEVFQKTRENRKYFPGVKLPDNIYSTDDFEQGFEGADVVLFTTPTTHLRTFCESVKLLIPEKCIVICGSKGLEKETCMITSQVIRDVNPRISKGSIAIISGPNYANEIIRGLWTTTVIASENDEVALRAYGLFKTLKFRPFITDDVMGVGLGGSLKNLVAMAVGVSDGMAMGNNAHAALKNRLTKEITRLSVVLGADERTLGGISGAGDVDVSSKPPGRNYLAGYDIGQGADPKMLRRSGKTIEGLETVEPAVTLADKFSVEVPLLQILKEIICDNLKPQDAIERVTKLDGFLYEDPQPIIDRRLRFPLRTINRVFHLWNHAT